MKLNSIITRYVIAELIQPFVINVLFFTFVFLISRILEITDMIVNYKVGLNLVLMIVLFTVPNFLIYVIPMSIMMTILLTFLKMSSDNEILALKAGGISLYNLVPPVMIFCAMGFVLTAFMTIFGQPWGRMGTKHLMIQMASSSADVGLKSRTFNDSFKDVMLYVNDIDIRNRTLIDVFIEDQRTKNVTITIVAPKGMLYRPDPIPEGDDKSVGWTYYLSLFNGTVNQVDLKNKSVNSLNFERYDVVLDLQQMMSNVKIGPKSRKEMTLSELLSIIRENRNFNQEYYEMHLELHKKFSLPFACFAMGLLAVPLGVKSKFARRSFGLGLGLASFLIYYMLLSIGMVFGETGLYPPMLGMWIPNIVMGGAGFYMIIKVASDRPIWDQQRRSDNQYL